MTKNENSPENLRKFLESEDLAMVMMGLSMAKGSGVPEELLPTILGLYMWDDDKNVRATAKLVFNMYAPENVKIIIKNNWKGSYRKLGHSSRCDKIYSLFTLIKYPQGRVNDLLRIIILPLTKSLSNKDVARTLVKMGDIATNELIPQLETSLSDYASEILEKMDNAVIPLITVVNEGNSTSRKAAIEALGNIKDKHAVESLISVLKDKDNELKLSAIEALKKIGDERAVRPLIETLKDKDTTICLSAAEALLSFTHNSEEVQWTDEMPDIIDSKSYDLSTLKLGREVWKANPDMRDSLSEMLRISKWKMVHSKHHNEIYQAIIKTFEDDWIIAGLLVWCGSHAALEETLTVKPNEIVSNYWVHGSKEYDYRNVESVNVYRGIIKRSGVNRVKGGRLEICKRSGTTCRGRTNIISPIFDTYSFGADCKGSIEKGELRFAVEFPNPDNPKYETTYYYCASCVYTYINIQKRYDIIKKWWPLAMKAKNIVDSKQNKNIK